MISFADSLRHLREAANSSSTIDNLVRVDRHDLLALLQDFDRLDQQVRNQHFKDHPEFYPPKNVKADKDAGASIQSFEKQMGENDSKETL